MELCVRKTNWAQKSGNLFLLKVLPASFEIRRVEHLDALHVNFTQAELPLSIKKGNMYAVCIDTKKSKAAYGFVKGSGFRATVIQSGKVIARIVAEQDEITQAGAVDSSKFLIPSAETPKLYFFIEAMTDGQFEFAT